jgi:nitrogen fixation/metabolism regulation signal transduction histidine kinase
LSDPTAITAAPRARYKRKLSNYLLDKKLQLRYVLLVTILSGAIAGALGYMIYDQRRTASASIEKDLQALTQADASHQDFQDQVASGLEDDDQKLVYEMIGVGIGLVIILSAYLVIMTHKVAGPLYKVSMYFDRMAEGRLGNVTPLRRGDMLQDFYENFHTMHDSVRARAQADVEAMAACVEGLRGRAPLAAELSALEAHLAHRKKQLA